MEADVNCGTTDRGRADGSQDADGEPMEKSNIAGTGGLGYDRLRLSQTARGLKRLQCDGGQGEPKGKEEPVAAVGVEKQSVAEGLQVHGKGGVMTDQEGNLCQCHCQCKAVVSPVFSNLVCKPGIKTAC